MKRGILLFILSLILDEALATHYRAGEIHYRLLGYNRIEATVVTYSKVTHMLTDRDSIEIRWGDGTGSMLLRTNGPDTDPQNGVPDGEFIEADIKKNIYIGEHEYAGAPVNGIYVLSIYDQNRMETIVNMSNSVNVPFYVETTLFYDQVMSAGINTSPMLLNAPTDYANLADTFRYNPVAYDADGDSLDFELVTPLQNANFTVPLYAYPDEFCRAGSSPSNVFQIDRHTGQIAWKAPCQQGIFNIAVMVREYRCGVLLSAMMRDMQIIVLNQPNDAPRILSPVHDTIINPGETIQFNVTAHDPNSGQVVSLRAMGGAFLLPSDTPVFQTTPGNPVNGNFRWQPIASHVRKGAYIFSIVARDNYMVNNFSANFKDYTIFRVWVADTTACVISGMEEMEEEAVSIYPNPGVDGSRLTVHSSMVNAMMEVYDANGHLVFFSKLTAQSSQLDMPLSKGVYFIRIHSEKASVVKRWVKL